MQAYAFLYYFCLPYRKMIEFLAVTSGILTLIFSMEFRAARMTGILLDFRT